MGKNHVLSKHGRGAELKGAVKKIDKDKFIEACNAWMVDKQSINKARKIVGLSAPTFTKYLRMVLMHEPLPDGLFFDDDEESE